MRIGLMKKRFTLEAESVAGDGAGGVSAAWAVVATVWGSIASVVKQSSLLSSVYEKRVTHTIVLRYRADVTVLSGMRLSGGGKSYVIRSVVNKDDAGRWIELLVEEGCLLGA